MSTNACIIVEGISYAKVYKHWDGGVDNTLPWLTKFAEEFYNDRGSDPQYMFAQLLRSSVRDADEFKLDDSKVTGWGIVDRGATFEYNYIVHKNGKVSCYTIDNSGNRVQLYHHGVKQ